MISDIQKICNELSIEKGMKTRVSRRESLGLTEIHIYKGTMNQTTLNFNDEFLAKHTDDSFREYLSNKFDKWKCFYATK